LGFSKDGIEIVDSFLICLLGLPLIVT